MNCSLTITLLWRGFGGTFTKLYFIFAQHKKNSIFQESVFQNCGRYLLICWCHRSSKGRHMQHQFEIFLTKAFSRKLQRCDNVVGTRGDFPPFTPMALGALSRYAEGTLFSAQPRGRGNLDCFPPP